MKIQKFPQQEKKEGVRKRLSNKERVEEVKNANLNEKKFKKTLKSVVDENDDVLRRLADK